MNSVIYVIFTTLNVCIDVITFLMLIRAVLSWFPAFGESSAVVRFIVGVTEFFISPVRVVMNRFNFVRNFPLDLSFTVTFFLFMILSGFLNFALAALI